MLRSVKASRFGLRSYPPLYNQNRTKYKYTVQTPEEKQEADSGRFKYFASAVIERIPILTPDAPKWYSDWFYSFVETQKKYGRDWSYDDIVEKIKGMQVDAKSKAGKKKKQEGGSLVINESKLKKQLGMVEPDPGKQRQINSMMEARKKMEHFPRFTIFDEADDRHHLYRCLDKSLYLLVEKYRVEEAWQFPLTVWNGKETMRQAAERAVVEDLGPEFRTYFLGNSPEGHWVCRFNEEQKKSSGFDGYKIFYYRTLMLGGNLNIDSQVTSDFAWSSKEQLKEYFKDDRNKLFQNMLAY